MVLSGYGIDICLNVLIVSEYGCPFESIWKKQPSQQAVGAYVLISCQTEFNVDPNSELNISKEPAFN